MLETLEQDGHEFDAAFFEAYEQQMGDVSLANLAQEALADILTIETHEGRTKDYATIREEAEAFFSNPLIAEDMQLLDQLANQYAHFCQSHGNEGLLDSAANLFGERVSGQDAHTGHSHDTEDDDEDEDELFGGKKTRAHTKKKRVSRSLWALLEAYTRKKG